MVTVVIHHTDEREDETIVFSTIDDATAYVEEFYSDCDIKQEKNRIEVVY